MVNKIRTFFRDGKIISGDWISADFWGYEWHRIGAVVEREETIGVVFETTKTEYFSRRNLPFQITYSKEIVPFNKNTDWEDIGKALLNYDILYKNQENSTRQVTAINAKDKNELVSYLVSMLGMIEDDLKLLQIKDLGFLQSRGDK